MVRVLSLHTAGLGELVAAAVTTELGARVVYADDSALMFDTEASPRQVRRLGFVKNSFVVLGSVSRTGDLAKAVDKVRAALPNWSLRRRGTAFRLMFSENGKLVPVPRNSRDRMVSAVERAVGGTFTPRGGADEYWMITRRNLDQVLFAERVERPERAAPPPGGLSPEVAELLVLASGTPRRDDVVLDPFAGTGALIAARIRSPFRRAICSDLGYGDQTAQLQPQLAGVRGVTQLADDARLLPSLADASVDVVVTDPPWGEFEGSELPARELLRESTSSIRRVLRPGGRLAVLVSRRLADDARGLWADNDLQVRHSYDLLINGHPATVITGTG